MRPKVPLAPILIFSVLMNVVLITADIYPLVSARTTRRSITTFEPSDATRTTIEESGNNPPAEPGAFECEPLKAAIRGR